MDVFYSTLAKDVTCKHARVKLLPQTLQATFVSSVLTHQTSETKSLCLHELCLQCCSAVKYLLRIKRISKCSQNVMFSLNIHTAISTPTQTYSCSCEGVLNLVPNASFLLCELSGSLGCFLAFFSGCSSCVVSISAFLSILHFRAKSAEELLCVFCSVVCFQIISMASFCFRKA